MLFNSIEYLFFLPFVFILYWCAFRQSVKWQNVFLLTASYFFYGWWSWKFLILLAFSTLLDYFYGFGVDAENRKTSKIFLWLSIVNNLGILALLKYYNFFALQIKDGASIIGVHFNPVLISIALPVGISFYTFHGMSYVFDIYRQVRKPVKSFTDYALFVSFFPLLVAGPIERSNHLLPQVQSRRVLNHKQVFQGCRLILWGMFKKVVIADSLGSIVDETFNHYHSHSAFGLIIGAIAFSFQIYGDFSGYSDIAIGSAKLFGFELLSNFRFPYFSRDIAEFWRRWHISLSSWFRDYLYIPIGGSRGGKMRAIRNIFIIFLVSGFWHGASWNFILWGFIHACAFLPIFILNKNRVHLSNVIANDRKLPSVKELYQIVTNFIIVTFAWIFFRAKDIKTALAYIKSIIVGTIKNPGQFVHFPQGGIAFIYIVPLLLLDWNFRYDERELTFKNSYYKRTFYIVIGVLVFLYFGQKQSFIYFQF